MSFTCPSIVELDTLLNKFWPCNTTLLPQGSYVRHPYNRSRLTYVSKQWLFVSAYAFVFLHTLIQYKCRSFRRRTCTYRSILHPPFCRLCSPLPDRLQMPAARAFLLSEESQLSACSSCILRYDAWETAIEWGLEVLYRWESHSDYKRSLSARSVLSLVYIFHACADENSPQNRQWRPKYLRLLKLPHGIGEAGDGFLNGCLLRQSYMDSSLLRTND